MPTYEYRCKACGSEFELFQKVTDPAPAECPKCAGGPIQKVFRSVGIIFKGSGFHVNDYRKDVPKKDDEPAYATPKTDTAAPAESSKPDASAPAETPKTESPAPASASAPSANAAAPAAGKS
jgi:putative FmdB family regulatory protein